MSGKIHAVETSPALNKTLITDNSTQNATPRPLVKHPEAALPKNFMKPKIDRGDFRKSRKILRANDTSAAIIAVVSIAFTYIEYEIYYDNDYESTWGTDFLRSLNVILSLVIICLVVRHYYIVLRFLKVQELIYPGSQLCQAEGVRKNMFREILLLCIISPPGLDITYEFEQLDGELTYSLDTLITLIYLLRFYFLLKLFKQYSSWTDQAAVNIGQRRNVIVDEVWALKCELRTNATNGLIFMLIFSIFVFGLALRTTEQPWPESDFEYIWNGWWIIAVSMTTIGYGEIVPTTHLGRAVVTASCIWGAFLLSAFVVVLIEGVDLEDNEEEVYQKVTERLYVQGKLQEFAIKYIQRRIRLFLYRRNKRISIRERLVLFFQCQVAAFRFKKARTQHAVQNAETFNDQAKKIAEKEPELSEVASEIKSLNPKVPEYKVSVNEFGQEVATSKNMYSEIETSTMRMFSVLRLLNTGSANKITDITDIKVDAKRETMARSTTMGSTHRLARRVTTIKSTRSMPQAKSLADKMEYKKLTSIAENFEQTPKDYREGDVLIRDLND